MPNIRIRIAALIKKSNEVLLIEHCKDSRSYWLLPGGGLEFGESVKECLQREMREETNLQVDVGDLAFTSESIDPHGQRHVIQMIFWCKIIGGEPKIGAEERLKSLAFVPIDKLNEYSLRPPLHAQLQAVLRGEKQAMHVDNSWCD